MSCGKCENCSCTTKVESPWLSRLRTEHANLKTNLTLLKEYAVKGYPGASVDQISLMRIQEHQMEGLLHTLQKRIDHATAA